VREASPQSVLNESLGTALWRHLQGGIKYLRLTTRSLTRWLRFTYEILRSVESSMVTMYFAAVLASGIAPVATIALTSRLIDAVGTADRRGLALFSRCNSVARVDCRHTDGRTYSGLHATHRSL